MKNPNPALAQRLAHLTPNERQKLYKRAATIKKSQNKRPRRVLDDDEFQEGETVKIKNKGGTLDEIVLRLLDEEELAQHALATGDVEREGVVTWVGKKACRVECGRTAYQAALNGFSVAVGDEAMLGGQDGEWLLSRLMPRRTKLSRPDPHNPHRELVIVANVDVVGIIVSVKAPPLHPRLIDRYLVAVQKGGARPLIVVNKLDLLVEGDRELEKLEPYRSLGVPVVQCSTETGQGIEDLREILIGKLCAFVGHSGVGKSSLLNALHPGLGIETGEVWQGYGRGTHTTTASCLHDLGQGIRLIDTPGIREFGLWGVGKAELKLYFPEFDSLTCRFGDCSHSHEPGCAVKAAVLKGQIAPARYDTYLRMTMDA